MGALGKFQGYFKSGSRVIQKSFKRRLNQVLSFKRGSRIFPGSVKHTLKSLIDVQSSCDGVLRLFYI